MGQYFNIHQDTPQMRLIKQVVDALQSGALAAIPTDAAYIIACKMGNKEALERMRQIRHLEENHHFTLMCRDLSGLGTYAHINNISYRLLKSLIPGAFTFILPATREVPKRLLHPKRKTIGLRVPQHVICQTLLGELQEPLLTTTLTLPHEEWPLADSMDIKEKIGHLLDVVIEGSCGFESTTVIDLTGLMPEIIRQGKGIL